MQLNFLSLPLKKYNPFTKQQQKLRMGSVIKVICIFFSKCVKQLMNYSTLGVGSSNLMSPSNLTSIPNHKFYSMFMNWKVFISKMHSSMYYILSIRKDFFFSNLAGNSVLATQSRILSHYKNIFITVIHFISIFIMSKI